MPSTQLSNRISAVISFVFGWTITCSAHAAVTLFPAQNGHDVNPDTHLVITFPSAPTIGKSGQIRIYDAADNKLVDTLDMSIPAGPAAGSVRGPAAPPTSRPYEYAAGHFTNANTKPGTPSGTAVATPDNYQLTIIGGFTDAFHFYPIIVHDNVATIYPHNNLLTYGKTYYVQVDPGVLSVADDSFKGIGGQMGWTFTTKKSPPAANSPRVVVSLDGSADFNTVQGAVDFIPDHNPNRVTIFIKNGTYEEIVYFRNKSNITFRGEDREKVIVGYANNEIFNPHPANVGTNEVPGTFPSRRAAFMVDHSTGIHLVNMSISNFTKGQAEGLLLVGGQHIVSNVTVTGSGDALQVNDSAYFVDSTVIGDGDTLLSRGPVFFQNCTWKSRGAFMWMRNTSASHGAVCVNCKFEAVGPTPTVIARAPTNGSKNYPNVEVVLINCALGNISPELFGPLGGDTTNMHFWEFNSTNLSDGKPADTSKRLAAVKQLDKDKDAETVANYSNPAYILGWTPKLDGEK
ncbi:MAG TPA: pectinesterase family protein [Tepidisphaeraceae bacterium]|nr:pectinesterase family protein [Tepidisphaeraceae bacterium]